MPRKPRRIIDEDLKRRLLTGVTRRNGCWIRGNNPRAYTRVKVGNKWKQAHRVSFELFRGYKLEFQGCHHCDTPACINPSHIFDGTQSDNIKDAVRKGRISKIKIESKADRKEKDRIIHEHQMGRSAFKVEVRKEIEPIPPFELMSRLRKLIGQE